MIGKLTHKQVEELLRGNDMGRLGCRDGDQIYVLPVNYVYDGKSIIGHSLAGKKIQMMRKNPNVCFQVDEIRDSSHWKSVIVWGVYQELQDQRDRHQAIALLTDKKLQVKFTDRFIQQGPDKPGIPLRDPEILRPVVYRIVITEYTGRYEND